MFPFTTWLPDCPRGSATAGSVILAGVLLKMGTYGFIRLLTAVFFLDVLTQHQKSRLDITLSIIRIITAARLR